MSAQGLDAPYSLAVKKIKPLFGDSPEEILVFAIVEYAIKDLNATERAHRITAERFLKSDMPMVEMCGVNPRYIRYVLKQLKLIEE